MFKLINKIQNDSPASLLQFANASRECERIAGPVLYFSITLSDTGDEETQLHTRELFERLLKKYDPIHDYVKELIIAEWGDVVDHSRHDIQVATAQANLGSSDLPFNASMIRNGESRLLLSSELENVLGNLRNLESFGYV
jgi:hypothetical protein